MTVYRLRVRGREVFSWEVEGEQVDPTELLADALASLVADDTPDGTPNHTPNDTDEEGGVSGGSSHNFERDTCPASPDDRYRWEWDDRFGFVR